MTSGMLKIECVESAVDMIADRSRGTPRICNRLVRRCRDYAQVRADGVLTTQVVQAALKLEGIDELGLDELDRRFLMIIIDIYKGGPVGIEAVAATLGEEVDTLVDVVEPYLLQIGLLARTRRGRGATIRAYQHLGLKPSADVEKSLFNGSDELAEPQG
jgi:Holliday junction DNA helicase RuvB